MYNKNKMLSAIAAVAILSSGAIAFDMEKGGAIITNYDASGETFEGNYTIDGNKGTITSIEKVKKLASYVGGEEANEDLRLSSNDDRGDALIYPAFKSGDGWVTKITVRNPKSVAVIAKAVIYAKDDSRELKDFNIYLSPHDVASFKIKENNVTTRDGSIIAGIDPRLRSDKVAFVVHDRPEETKIVDIESKLDSDGDFVIASFDEQNKDVTDGYVIIYAMTESTKRNAYHGKHERLYKDYRRLLDICRDVDNNSTNTPPWQKIFSKIGGSSVNGTATGEPIHSPNVHVDCYKVDENKTDPSIDGPIGYERIRREMDSNFTSPSSNALFGEVTISHKKGPSKADANKILPNRSLLLKAKVLDNYTTDNQMMLWAPGEYAAIQDRRLYSDGHLAGRVDDGRMVLTRYDVEGILADADCMKVTHTYYTFNKKSAPGDTSTLLLTQPMKRALVMAGKGDEYWTDFETYKWGQFSLDFQFYNENENLSDTELRLETVTSPIDSDDEELYSEELAALNHDIISKGLEKVTEDDKNRFNFKIPDVSGYVDVMINPGKGLPAIVTEMVSEEVGGEAQINWIYSAILEENE
jgi:hypothetical protein